VVGVNKYIVDDEIPNAMFRVDPESERKAIEKIKAFRAQRDDEKLEKALSRVKKAAIKIKEEWPGSCGVLMPALIEAFKAQATIGETHRILKEIWGYGYSK
jgi:methylmalonyl-CoA mutase N-terminal domain/subunit